jgi:membrane-associated phospholipid phosphatase
MPIRPRTALLSALACVALLALDWFAAFHVGFVRDEDQTIYHQFVVLQVHGHIAWIAEQFVALFDPNPYVYLALAPLVVAAVRGRPRVVVGVGVIILGANMTTEVLKHLLATPRAASLFGGVAPLPPASWPSGHSTAVMSLALASVLAAPARLRPAATALGTLLAIAVGYSILAAGLHYPSDVFAGFLVAAAWTLAAVAVLLAAERRRPVLRTSSSPPVSVRAALGAPGAVVVAALALTMMLIVVHPHDVVTYARAHQAFVVGAAAVAALSLALSTGVLLSVRR